jgi:hypothetical protein
MSLYGSLAHQVILFSLYMLSLMTEKLDKFILHLCRRFQSHLNTPYLPVAVSQQ